MEPDRIWNTVSNPAWRPFTNADVPGYFILGGVGFVLIILTVWTYLGSTQVTPRRLAALVTLRLLALLIAILMAIRPSVSVTDQPKLPSTLILAIDVSESMTVRDEFDSQTRWQVVQNALKKAEPLLEKLREEQQVTVHLYGFAKDFNPSTDIYDPPHPPDGKRTEFGTMLARIGERYGAERHLRGLLIISDGADNGTRPALAEASRFRGIGCPIYTFGVGRIDTRSDQKDVAFTSVTPDPAPAPIKSDLTIRARLNAQGLEGVRVKIRMTISRNEKNPETGEEIDTEVVEAGRTIEVQLPKAVDNEIEIKTKAPDKPGEYRIRLDIPDPPPGDVSVENNRIETYLTVTKEGVRILVVDRVRTELKFLRYALGSDKRFDVVEVIRQTEGGSGDANEASKLNLENEAYDVIIIGDVSRAAFLTLGEKFEEAVADRVKNKGMGLLMTGGAKSFGEGGWRGSPLGSLMPVDMSDIRQIDDKNGVAVHPSAEALRKNHYLLRLDPNPEKSKKLWDELNKSEETRLGGFTELGKSTPRGEVLLWAKAIQENERLPLMVTQDWGTARVVALGADDTWKWVNISREEEDEKKALEGMNLHARFWKQLMLWLAHQDETEGSVYARPDLRRLPVNGKNTIRMGVKDKFGDDIKNADVRYQVLAPGDKVDQAKARRSERDAKGQARVTYEVKQPGEYTVVVWGKGVDGEKEVEGEASARFFSYPDISDEMLRPAANHEFLLSLENIANGTAPEVVRTADKLDQFLEKEFVEKPLRETGKQPKAHPDWRRKGEMPWFLPTLLVIFVALLCTEWGLRRLWGMV